jgi:hypothetical protein
MHRVCCLARRYRAACVRRAGNARVRPSPCAAAAGGRCGRGVAPVPSASIYPQGSCTPTQSRDCRNYARGKGKWWPPRVMRVGHAFSDFDSIDSVIGNSTRVGFAFPLQNDQFIVVRFDLSGSKAIVNAMRKVAGERAPTSAPRPKSTKDQVL